MAYELKLNPAETDLFGDFVEVFGKIRAGQIFTQDEETVQRDRDVVESMLYIVEECRKDFDKTLLKNREVQPDYLSGIDTFRSYKKDKKNAADPLAGLFAPKKGK